MQPISVTCRAQFDFPPAVITSQILDLSKWTDWKGYGPLPAIKSAEFEVKTPEVVGTRIRVVNSDGSSHVEEITTWRPDERVELRFGGFSPPLSRMATHFIETWEFEPAGATTNIKRSMHLYPKSIWAVPLLWMISFLLKRALARHLRQLSN
jgi:hypothetical protein